MGAEGLDMPAMKDACWRTFLSYNGDNSPVWRGLLMQRPASLFHTPGITDSLHGEVLLSFEIH